MTEASERSEQLAKRAIEDRGFKVHDANVVFWSNCPNIDLVVYGKRGATYVQVKSSSNPANKDSVVIDGSGWTEAKLKGAPVYNKHADEMQASLVIVVDNLKSGGVNFYVAPPAALENLVRPRAVTFANLPKRDGAKRSPNFKSELPRELLTPWLNAWHLLDAATDRGE